MRVPTDKYNIVPSRIPVLVVDGEFTTLHKLGFPLPVLATVQEAGFNLRDACWDVKKPLSHWFFSEFLLAYPD